MRLGKFRIGFDSTAKALRGITSTWGDRTRAMMTNVLGHQTAQMQETVQARMASQMSKEPTLRDIAPAIRRARVLMPGNSSAAQLVYVDPKAVPKKKIRELSPKSDIVYIRPKNTKRVRIPPAIQILAQYSPWPLDMLPMYPSTRQAVIITRTVTSDEVDRVRQSREDDKISWRAELSRLGIQIDKANANLVPPKLDAVPDVAFTVLRMELGIGNTKAKPVWKPSLKEAAKSTRSFFVKSPVLKKTMLDPKFKGWLPSSSKVKSAISQAELKNYVRFQKALKAKI